jgi:predicted ester cyclase
MTNSVVNPESLAQLAKDALERVCSGANLDRAADYYSRSFVDHVNDLEFYGLEGARRSVDLYRKLLAQIEITVQEQVVTRDRVVSRFIVSGTSYGRRVRFGGITISRFENGLIAEDWSVTDTLGMLRQLGLLRSIVVGARSLATLSDVERRRSRSRRRRSQRYVGSRERPDELNGPRDELLDDHELFVSSAPAIAAGALGELANSGGCEEIDPRVEPDICNWVPTGHL